MNIRAAEADEKLGNNCVNPSADPVLSHRQENN